MILQPVFHPNSLQVPHTRYDSQQENDLYERHRSDSLDSFDKPRQSHRRPNKVRIKVERPPGRLPKHHHRSRHSHSYHGRSRSSRRHVRYASDSESDSDIVDVSDDESERDSNSDSSDDSVFDIAFSRYAGTTLADDSTLASFSDQSEKRSPSPSAQRLPGQPSTGTVIEAFNSRYTGDLATDESRAVELTTIQDSATTMSKGVSPLFRWM